MRAAARVSASLLALLSIGSGTALAAALPAPTRPFVALDVTVNTPARRISGVARWRIPNLSARPVSEVLFWLYPNRLGDRPEALGDVTFHWLYPNGFSPASIQIESARVGGIAAAVRIEQSSAGRDTVARVILPAAVPAGGEITVELAFVTQLPERLGGFGCAARQCRVMGGFYPFPLHLGPGGFQTEAPPDRIDYSVRLLSTAGGDVLLGGAYFRAAGQALDVAAVNAPHITLVTDQGLDVDTASSGSGGSGEMRALFFHRPAPRPPSSAGEVLPYVREDRVGLVMDAAARALAFVAGVGLRSADTQAESPVVLIQAPLRHELVQVHGEVVLVSDRLFEIFPVERLRKFHRLELIRGVVAAVLNRALRNTEPDPDVDLASEVAALHLTQLFTLREFRRVEFAGDLLRPFAFIPAIDQLLYAPLVASTSSYFGDPADRDAIRDDVRRFSHRRGGGRLVHAKLLDLLGASGMERLVETMLAERLPLRQAAARTFGGELDWFWRQWLSSPPPRLNYRLERIQSSPLPADVGGTHVVIEIRREGADLLEPVEVRVVDRAGAIHDLVWKGKGAAHRFEVDLPAGLASVEIDPRHRLIESAVGSLDAADDPLADNRVPKSWRFLYSGAAALLDVTALDASFAAAVKLKPRHDLRNSILFLAHHSPSTVIGVKSAYARLFGAQADRNRLTSAFGVGMSAALLNRDFGVATTETLHPHWRLAGSLFTEHDDRDYVIDPWRAVGMTAEVTYSLTGLDDGQRLSQLSAGIELLRLFELSPGHVLAVDVQGGATFGDIRVRSQLPQIGGPTGLRGYAPGELFGRGWALGRIELRNRYVSDLNWNLAQLTAVRGFGGNLFFEAGLVSSCAELSVSDDGAFYDVGYSFRVLHDAFGVYQQLLTIDVAVPLNRHDRLCLGQHSVGTPGEPQPQLHRPPFVVLISFLPTF